MNQLLGFAVLTSPLWVILILLAAGIWIAAQAAKRFERRNAKVTIAVVVFLLLFIVPFGDQIAGSIYFKHLCATKAGVKVYTTFELPAEYWNSEGKPKFYDTTTGNFNLSGYRVQYKNERYSPILHIDNAAYSRVHAASGKVLGEAISFRYWGGWIKRNLSPHNTATSCEGGLERSNDLIRQIFKPKKL